MQERIIKMFEKAAVENPSAVAILEEYEQVTYEGLHRRVQGLAHLLAGINIRQKVVMVMLPSGIKLGTALLAALKTGAVYVPVSDQLSEEKLNYLLDLLPIHALVTDRAGRAVLDKYPKIQQAIAHLLILDKEGVSRYNEGVQEPVTTNTDATTVFEYDPKAACYCYFTSGTTGKEKCIEGRAESLHHYVQWHITHFGFGAGTRVSQIPPPTFDASLKDYLPALCSGATVLVPGHETKMTIPSLVTWLHQNGADFIQCVPSILRLIMKHLEASKDPQLLKSLSGIVLAGERLYGQDVNQWRRLMGDTAMLYNLYGCTETTILKTCYAIAQEEWDANEPIPIGKPIDKTAVVVLADGKVCQPGEEGEVYLRSPYFTNGYYKDPELTDTVFVQNPLLKDREDIVYKTGDLGVYREDKQIIVTGRVDLQLKVNGIRLEPEYIEKRLLKLAAVEHVAVVNVAEDQAPILAAFYSGQSVSSKMLRSEAMQLLEPYMVPSHFQWLEQLPLSANGKVDRMALQLETAYEMVADEASASEEYRKLHEIICTILNQERIARDTSFFSVGFSSLKALEIISEVFENYEVLLKIDELFADPTIEFIYSQLTDAPEDAFPEIIPVSSAEDYVASHAQKRLWLLEKMEDRKDSYTINGAYRITGAFDPGRFRNALDQLVRYHEILRTTFSFKNGEVRQVIHETMDIDSIFTVKTLDRVADPAQSTLVSEFRKKIFDLEKGPLLGILIIGQGDEYQLYFHIHHIISDRRTTEIIIDQLLNLYGNEINPANGYTLPGTDVHYKEFADWENRLLLENATEYQHFWREKLSGQLPVLQLPFEQARPATRTTNGDQYDFVLNRQLKEKLEVFCQQEDCTYYMVLLSAAYYSFYYFTDDTEFIIGTSVSDRERIEFRDQIGLYLNQLPVRNRFSDTDTFRQLIEKTKEEVVAAFAHKQYPLNLIGQEVINTRDHSRSFLFDVMLDMIMPNDRLAEKETLPFDIEIVPDKTVASRFDLSFYFMPKDQEIWASMVFNTDLFHETNIREIADCLVDLLDDFEAALEQPIRSIKDTMQKRRKTDVLSGRREKIKEKMNLLFN